MRTLLQFQFECNDFRDHCRPASFAAIMAAGELSEISNLVLMDKDLGFKIPAHIECSDYWADGSIRWLNFQFTTEFTNSVAKTYAVVETTKNRGETEHILQLADRQRFSLDLKDNRIDVAISSGFETDKPIQQGSYTLFLKDRHSVSHQVKLNLENNLQRSTTEVNYDCLHGNLEVDGKPLVFKLELSNYRKLGLLQSELTIHNPAAATHKDGLWDLGDPGSVHFQELYIRFEADHLQNIELLTDTDPIAWDKNSGGLSIKQYSSGGDNRQHPNHVCSNGTVANLSKGYTIDNGKTELQKGARISPIVIAETGADSAGSNKIAIYLHNFWEEFPAEFTIESSKITVSMFALVENSLHELQAGEKKRRKVSFLTVGEKQDVRWIRNEFLSPVFIDSECSVCNTISGRAVSLGTTFDSQLQQFVAQPQEFDKKRELIDEYGWRNFGDVFADHESLYVKEGENLHVSHYNNQYDVVLGFGLQYLRTGDYHWLRLMNDLARHVVDIDIYDTRDDRVEYNHGLFWHTNHYEDARTSSHRTFSRANYDASDPRSSSGGPATEHCYTSGLLLHYRLTGDESSADTVMKLAKWILVCHKGDGSFKSTLRSVFKHEFHNVALMARSSIEPIHRYSFDRGTGNLVEACLDAFDIRGEHVWIETAGAILLDTFSACDNIESRPLLEDIELCWSYTVFLQSALRFMSVKFQMNDVEDEVFAEVHSAFVHYTRWMLKNEVPYLENVSRLEFVNDTWVAQDIRKHTLLVAAAVFDEQNADFYLERAKYFEKHVIDQLSKSETLHYTRIQALILLNIGIGSAVLQITPMSAPAKYITRKPKTIFNELYKAVLLVTNSLLPKKTLNKYRSLG